MKCINVLIIDRQPLYRDGFINNVICDGIKLNYHELSNVGGIYDFVKYANVDVLVIDFELVDFFTFKYVDYISRVFGIKLMVVLSEYGLFFDVYDYFLPDSIVYRKSKAFIFMEALESLINGNKYYDLSFDCNSSGLIRCSDIDVLTGREKEVLSHLVCGDLNKQIAFKMRLRENTVKSYVSNMLKKLDISNRTILAKSARPFFK